DRTQFHCSTSVSASELETKADPIERGGESEDDEGTPGGAGKRASQPRPSEFGIPVVEVKQAKDGRQHLGKEIGQENVLPGNGERFGKLGEIALRVDIGQQVE